MQARLHLSAFAVVALSLSGCGEESAGTEGAGAAPPEGTLVYYRDLKPLIDQKCGNCHVAGGIAPFALTTYEQVESHAVAIKSAVAARTMPPWPASKECNSYLNDRSLSDDEIATIVTFVDQGAHAGDPKDVGAPLVDPDSRPLSRVDRELAMPEPYTMVESPDEYRCFVLDWAETEPMFVTGLGVAPGNAAVVHHVIAFLAAGADAETAQSLDAGDPGHGYKCFGGPGFRPTGWLGAWAPGSMGYDYPDGTGVRIEPGSKIVMQLHYNSLSSGPQPDQTAVRLKVDPTVEKEATLQPWTNPTWVSGTGMEIPPATSGVTHEFGADPTVYITNGEAMLLHTSFLHMHQLGKSGRVTVQHSDGTETCLLDIPAWDFHWQGAYAFKEPVRLEPGDKLALQCTWDNPTMNEVKWGEGTGDEMCLTGVYFTLAD